MRRAMDLRRVRQAFPTLDPDVPLRYRPILERLDAAGSLLEVGRGVVGIAHLVDSPVVTCDVARPEVFAPQERFVLATGTALPFPSGSFDSVVVVDVLEHVPGPRKRAVVEEATRVARHFVFLAGPIATSAPAEARVQRLLAAVRGSGNPWLDEHRTYGLPTRAEVLDAVPPGWAVEEIPNVNLAVWTLNRLLVDAAGVSTWALAALGDLLDFGTTYRTVFVLRRATPEA